MIEFLIGEARKADSMYAVPTRFARSVGTGYIPSVLLWFSNYFVKDQIGRPYGNVCFMSQRLKANSQKPIATIHCDLAERG